MIVRLTGRLSEKTVGACVIDVGGVGFACAVSMYTLTRLPDPGAAATLHTVLELRADGRNDGLALFGFIDEAERAAFVGLTSVSGVGPKIALALLGGLTPAGLVRAVHAGDKAALQRVPGIGTRLAERIVVELKGRVERLLAPAEALPAAGPAPAVHGDAAADLELALRDMGYKPAEVERVRKRLGDAVGSLPLIDLVQRALAVLHGGER